MIIYKYTTMSENSTQVQTKPKKFKIKKIEKTAEDEKKYKITDNVELYIGDSLNISRKNKFRMIYFDPPFNSDRNYTLNCDSELGFSDKWTNENYEKFITKQNLLLLV